MLNDEAALIEYPTAIVTELRASMMRVRSDFSVTLFKAKLVVGEKARLHTMLVFRCRGLEGCVVSVRLHHGGPRGAKPRQRLSRSFWRLPKSGGVTQARNDPSKAGLPLQIIVPPGTIM